MRLHLFRVHINWPCRPRGQFLKQITYNHFHDFPTFLSYLILSFCFLLHSLLQVLLVRQLILITLAEPTKQLLGKQCPSPFDLPRNKAVTAQIQFPLPAIFRLSKSHHSNTTLISLPQCSPVCPLKAWPRPSTQPVVPCSTQASIIICPTLSLLQHRHLFLFGPRRVLGHLQMIALS